MTWVNSAVALSGGAPSGTAVPGGAAGVDQAELDALTIHTSGWVNVKSHGALGDGITDDTAAIQAAASAATAAGVFLPGGTYRVTSNITVSVPVHFGGGAKFSVDSGDTLTITGAISAGDASIFAGAGTVHYEGQINIGWFDGATINDKWNFLRRGIVANKHYTVIVNPPLPTDPAYSDDDLGYGGAWKVTAPLDLDDVENLGTFYFNGAVLRIMNSLPCVFNVGVANKTEHLRFNGIIRVVGTLGGAADPDGSGSAAEDVFRINGGGHIYIQKIEAWKVGSALRLVPTVGTVNEVQVDAIYSARQTAPVVYAVGSSGTYTVTEVRIGRVDTDGTYSTSPASSVVYLKGAVQVFSVDTVVLRAVVAGHSDVATAKVLIENNALKAPTEAIRFGQITTGINTAKLLQIRDTTGGSGPKTGSVIVGAIPWAYGNVDLAWCQDIFISNVIATGGGTITVGSTCERVVFSGVSPDVVTDNGVLTIFDGRVVKRYSLVADDSAVSFTLPSYVNRPFRAFVTTTAAQYGEARLRTQSTPLASVIGGAATFAVTTGALTGTTGTDGNLTLSAASGTVYVENRTGGQADIDVVLDVTY